MSNDECRIVLDLMENTEVVAELKNIIKNAPVHIVEDIKRDVETYLKNNGSLEGFSKRYTDDIGIGELTDAQTIGVAWMYFVRAGILADEVGLGKTVQVAGLINLLRAEYRKKNKRFRFLFLGEKVAVSQLRDKLIQFTGVYVGLLPNAEQKNVDNYINTCKEGFEYSVVGTHALIHNPSFLLHMKKNPYDLVIVDESYFLKNSRGNNSFATAKSIFKEQDRLIFLNATPVEMKLEDMYNQLYLVDSTYMMDKSTFNKMFVTFKQGLYRKEFVGYKNEERFKELTKLKYFSRTRKDLGAVYENNECQTYVVPFTRALKNLQDRTSMYRMVVDYPSGIDRNYPFTPESCPKLGVLLHIIKEEIKQGEKQGLIFCDYKDAQRKMKLLIEEKGYRVEIMNGDTKEKDRVRLQKEYNNGNIDILIISLTRGVDLDSCDVAIVYSIDPNPQKLVQFEGRMTRTFDIKNKKTVILVSQGKELKRLNNLIRDRVLIAQKFTNTGNSMILDALANETNRTFIDWDIYRDENLYDF